MEITNLNKDRKFKKKPSVDLGSMVFGKIPPQSKELEDAVFGAVML
jgi:replicative DNA helicase